MKSKTPFLKMAMFGSLFFLLVVWHYTYASSKTATKNNFCCNGTQAIGVVRALAYGAAQGKCDITSKTKPSTTINIIGWTWWQCRTEDNNGTIINATTRPARSSPPASNVSDLTTANYCNYAFSPPKCGYRLRSHGNHDFNHTGASQWQPYNATVGP